MKIQTIHFERKKGIPLYRQLYLNIRDEILAGRMQQGDQLPSIRQCEQLLKVSKTSIERAYELLLMEGYIQALPQKGFYIDVDERHRKIRYQFMQQTFTKEKPFIRYDFRSQTMDKDAFDTVLWKRYSKEVLDCHDDIGTYGDAQGEYVLRLALSQYAYAMRGVLASPDQLLIGGGFQSLLYILCGFFKKGSVIGIEESGFLQAEQVFLDYGFIVIKLASVNDGISIDELKQKQIQILFLNTGNTGRYHKPLSITKRKALLNWARVSHALIIEDDHNGELRYHSRPIPCMQSYDIGEHILYIGSFSKLLLPSLRISYLVMTHSLCNRYEVSHYGPGASKIEQITLARYINDGHLERLVKRLCKRYEQKSKQMLSILKELCPNASYYLEEAGLQIIVRFPFDIAVTTMLDKCKEAGILINTNGNDIVLSFAGIADKEMRVALTTLIDIWKAVEPRIKM